MNELHPGLQMHAVLKAAKEVPLAQGMRVPNPPEEGGR
jgi:hypothetical protein